MAEFVSAIVGLAVVGLQTGKVLHNLIETFRDAPAEILAVSDEVNAFWIMLSKLKEVDELGEWTSEERTDSEICLSKILMNGERIAKETEKLIEKVRREGLGVDRKTRMKAIQWIRVVKKTKKLQEMLRVQKTIVCNFVAVRTLKCSAKHGLQVTRLEMKVDMMMKNQLSQLENQDRSAEMNSQDRSAEMSNQNRLAEMSSQNRSAQKSASAQERDEKANDAVLQLADNNDKQIVSSKWSATTSCDIASSSLSLSMEMSLSHHHIGGPKETNITLFPSPNTAMATPLNCLKDCKCRCHFRSVVRSPRLLSNCLGNVILGFSNLPWAASRFSQCDEQTCRRMASPETEFKYFLPSWFSYAVANFKVDLAIRFLPLNIHVRSLNTIPYDSPILVCTQEGDIEGIVRLLQSGAASLYDVDPYGLGLLYYASYYCWRSSGKDMAIRTCQFLLNIGADTDLEDERGCTPMDTLIGDTLVSLSMKNHGSHTPIPSDFEHITQLFGKSSFELVTDFVRISSFTTIHKVLLGIHGIHETLNEHLKRSEAASNSLSTIDTPDSTGRSALAWAVEYGWGDATRVLLQYGANPNQLVRSPGVMSPLLHLAIAMPVSESTDNGSLDVVKELLKAGADINAVDHENWTPLHVAASWNNYEIIQQLATFGGNRLDWELLTSDNQSAMDLSLNAGVNDRVQSILNNRRLSKEKIDGIESHRHDDGLSESEEERFFDSKESWCCA